VVLGKAMSVGNTALILADRARGRQSRIP